ncbi:MAG: hypothetical protein QXR31_05550, partial [Zestosphaera sp.]
MSLQAAAQPQNQANPNVITNEDINKIIENLKILQQNITDIQRQLEKLSETIRKDLTNIQKNITDIQRQLKVLNETVIKIREDINKIIENLKILQQNITDIQRQLKMLNETVTKIGHDIINIRTQSSLQQSQLRGDVLNQFADIRSIILLLVVLSIVNLV